jgi:hypothetical protein
MPTAGGAGVDTLRPQHVWSPKRLNWPTVTRAHALRRLGAAGGAAPRPLRAAAGPRRRRRRHLGALCWRRAPAPVAWTGIRRPTVRTAGRRVVVLPVGTARPCCSSSCS